MTVREILEKIVKEARLGKERAEIENLFYQLVFTFLLKNLHQELNKDQRDELLRLVSQQSPDFMKINSFLSEAGLKTSKRERLIDSAIRNALKEVLGATGDKLSPAFREELLQVIEGDDSLTS